MYGAITMTNSHLYFLHALSPLHAGTGQGTGVIDLPIAREKATGIPYLAGTSVKGVLRDKSMPWIDKNKPENQLDPQRDVTFALFGPPTDNAEAHAGSLQVSDARLLLFPVRSLRGTFAWVTSPYILSRFVRDHQAIKSEKMPALPSFSKEQQQMIQLTKATTLLLSTEKPIVVLEDLDLRKFDGSSTADAWAEYFKGMFPSDLADLFDKHFAIVADDVMNFLLRNATEIVARIRLETETKTVAQGALWYEESLPAESLLYGIFQINENKKARDHNGLKDEDFTAKLREVASGTMQFGGKSTVGRGLCQLHVVGGK
jgi:CRISPR-associated protein Cmr4